MTQVKFPSILEKTTAIYRAQIGDENGDPLSGSVLLTLCVTFYDLTTGDIINGRNNQDILNKNNAAVDATGLLTWRLDPADTYLVSTDNKTETRIALFTWTWGTPEKTGRFEERFTIKNLEKVT